MVIAVDPLAAHSNPAVILLPSVLGFFKIQIEISLVLGMVSDFNCKLDILVFFMRC
jgi:hypothetical protein